MQPQIADSYASLLPTQRAIYKPQTQFAVVDWEVVDLITGLEVINVVSRSTNETYGRFLHVKNNKVFVVPFTSETSKKHPQRMTIDLDEAKRRYWLRMTEVQSSKLQTTRSISGFDFILKLAGISRAIKSCKYTFGDLGAPRRCVIYAKVRIGKAIASTDIPLVQFYHKDEQFAMESANNLLEKLHDRGIPAVIIQ